MLGETGIDMRNEDLLPLLSTAQNVARITIEIEGDSFLRPLSFYSRGAMLGETGIDMRNEDLLPLLSTAQNVARITIEIEDPSGNRNPGLKGVLYSAFSRLAALLCQSPQPSSRPDFCRLSEITDDSCSATSERTPKSGEERSTCCCGRAVELDEPEKPYWTKNVKISTAGELWTAEENKRRP